MHTRACTHTHTYAYLSVYTDKHVLGLRSKRHIVHFCPPPHHPFIFLEGRRKGDPNLTRPGCILSRMVGFICEWVHCTQRCRFVHVGVLIWSIKLKRWFVRIIPRLTHTRGGFICTLVEDAYRHLPERFSLSHTHTHANTHNVQVSDAWVHGLLVWTEEGGGVSRS